MATHKHALPSGCHRGSRAALVLALAATSALTLTAGTGVAEPAPTVAEVQARAAALDLQVDQAVEDYQQAQVSLEGLRVRAAAADAEVARQQQVVASLQGQVAEVVAAAYRNGTAGQGLQLLTRSSSPQAYLDKATSLDQLAAEQSQRLVQVSSARVRLDKAVRQAQLDLAAQQEVEQQAAQHKQTVEADLAESQALLDSLQASQRAELAAAQAAAAAAAAPVAPAVAPDRASRSRTPAPVAPPADTGAASGRAAIAVQEAYRKLGSPYVWGASGPSTFDCSGLTSWVWAKAGVSLPHSSRAQYAGTRHVSQGEAQPGDLVFFGSPIHHVGIYVGGGNMISAPHTGDVVKVQPAFRGDFVGVTRP